MKTVLLLSTYPALYPRHGGQVRVANISKTFKDDGWEVFSLAVYEPEGYDSSVVGPNDVEFPLDSKYRKFRGMDIPLINDYLTGAYAVAPDGGLNKILAKLPERLDAIHVEQPWLWPLAKRIKSIPKYSTACLIHGSQNIEGPLKREILESYNVKNADLVLHEIDQLEREASLEADITIAVTKADFDVIEAWGAKQTVLAPNGIAPWHATHERLEYWKEKLPKSPWILYVASAHPPNFTGFNECIGGSLACIPPDSKLVVAGSVGEHLFASLSASRWGALNLSRLQILYVLSDEDLAAVKSLAHAFLLPIPHGGGSNIKTAEAIYSNKYVIGTEAAFRGFEEYKVLPEVFVAKSPEEFHGKIRWALTSEEAGSSGELQQISREGLTWANSLGVVPRLVNGFLNKVDC
ncbi:hypothetical protein [Pseudomonas faucium]|uniref:hypothetical protein n=1 Tax=Pseudomonas faucium TaxID=2740518 RepID=UPI001F27ACC1|nr:hypothetical protein [Pseudomonas faucium]